MTPTELRALADALSNGTHFVESPELHEAMLRAADYLRQCADAVPVAWLYRDAPWFDGVHWHDQDDCTIDVRVAKFKDKSARPLYTHPAPVAPHHAMLDSHRRLVEQAIQSAEHPPGMSTHDGKAHIDASILRRMLAIIDSLPAAPQAEPKRDWSTIDAAIREYLDDYELIGEDDAGADACYTPTERELYLIYDAINGLLADESFVAAISAPQAEPKREPLSDERIAEIQRAAYERAAQECIETAAELRRCADGCTDGRYDWKADGAADCADAISALGRQQ